ncbi:hypothetical protein HYH02_010028 [Chlamydomonas schloesseri]|uniref:TAZ-type domain-containing protein n=1 Tax=Chlamydomonas schloesseri TaxID=2026947 RepID=A0A835TP57_9CHLO|nr:hypothetical protein HYH02_010028 [Chlamydomonas schloesseri]|eukprot:KAG2441440.1 hypothetical protein HYH02_010028 [Chlamydomonas schloesseri]
MFHYHCKDCCQTEDRCEYGATCASGKNLFQHVQECHRADCTHPRCGLIKDILNHHNACKDESCRVCTPVRSYQQTRSKPPTASPGTSSSEMAAPPLPLPPPPPAGGAAGGHSHHTDDVPATPLTEMLMQVLKSEPLPVAPPLTPQLQPGESAHPLQPSPPEGADNAMEVGQQQVQQQQQQQQQLAADMERSHSLPMLPAAQPPQLQQQGSLAAAFAASSALSQAQAQQQAQAQGRKMGGLFEARQRERKRQATDVGQGANFSAASGLQQQQQQQQQHQQQQQQQQQMATLAAARASAPTSGASGAGSGGGGIPSSVPGMSHSLSASLGVTGPGELSTMYLQEMQLPGGGGGGPGGAATPTILVPGAGSTPPSMQLPQLQHLAQQQQQQPAGAGSNPFQRSSLPNITYNGQAPQQQQQQQQQQQPGATQPGVLVYSNGVVAHAVPPQPLVVSGLSSSGHHLAQGPPPLGSGAAMGLHAAQHTLPVGGPAAAAAAANAAGGLTAASAAAAGAAGGMLTGSLSFGLGQPGKQGAPLGGAPNGFTLAGPGAPPQGPGPQYVALPYGGYAQMASHGGVTYTIVHHPHPAHSTLGAGFATVGSAPGGGPGGAPSAAQGYLVSVPTGGALGGPGGPGGQQATWSVLQHPTAGLLHAHPQMSHAAGPHGLSAAGPAGAMHFGGPGLGGAALYAGGPGGAAGGAAPGQAGAHLHHPHQLSHLTAMPLGGGLLAAPAGAVPLSLSAQMAAGAT